MHVPFISAGPSAAENVMLVDVVYPTVSAVATGIVIGVLVGLAFFGLIALIPSSTNLPSSSTSSTTDTTTTSRASTTSHPNGMPYLSVPSIYADLGYPTITYNDYFPYLPKKPNFTLTYHNSEAYLHIGTVASPVIGLDQAVGLAADYAKLDPANFSLGAADFIPGDIVNSSLSNDPSWLLFFARTHQGFWTFGSCGNGAFSVFATVDALTGTVSESASHYCEQQNSPRISGQFELRVNSSRALQVIRASSVPDVPAALTENGMVSSILPRIVLFGPSSNNAAFKSPLNASLSGMYRLCWIVEMYSTTPEYGYQGTFAVDAATGELASGWANSLYPSMHIESVSGAPLYSSAKNLIVSNETFQMSGVAIGSPNSVPASIPDVVIARPGSVGSIELNFSSTVSQAATATFSFSSIPSGGVPSGVSASFANKGLVIPANGQAQVTLLISVDKNAPSGTYLIEVKASLLGTQSAGSPVFFFLSVWNGIGQWPPPPLK